MQSVIRSPLALGAALGRARRATGLTQKALGARANLRQATISSLERGEGATLETVFAVLACLKLELDLRERGPAPVALDEMF